jgi:single-stranded DNA-binding protein
MDDKATFTIVGCVASPRQGSENPRIGPSGKKATLRLELCRPGKDRDRPSKSYHDVVAFDADMIDQMRALGIGESVLISGDIQPEKVVDRARNPVQSDGYDIWKDTKVARKVETLAQSAEQQPRTAQASTAIPASDDDIPF